METRTLIASRYRLDRPIEAGGMGAVWRGFDTLLERAVAVKVLRSGIEEADRCADRFFREAKTLAGLAGPGLVEIYDYGEDTAGGEALRYIVMELIEGPSLAAVLAERGALGPEQTLRYTIAAADTLALAHGKGIVHRDIKPGNLLIEPGDRLRVVDFGISLSDGQDRLTSPGLIMGTTSYASPEQVAGWQVRAASDLYSLGAVAYECLTGAPPFRAEDPLGVVHMHLYEDPPQLPCHVPPELAEIVLRCLRKDPHERWPDAAALAEACRAALAVRRTAADPAPVGPGGTTGEPRTRSGRRRRARRSAMGKTVAAAVLVLAVIAVLAIWRPWAPDRAGDASEPVSAIADRSPSGPIGPSPGASAPATPVDRTEVADDSSPTSGTDEQIPDPSGTVEAPSASGDALPDVRGMDAAEARAYLEDLGWTDVRVVSTLLLYESQPEGCEIVNQNPKPQVFAEYDQPVKIAHWGLHDCP